MTAADMSGQAEDQGVGQDQGSGNNLGVNMTTPIPDMGPPPPPGMFRVLGDRCAEGDWSEDLEVSPGMFGLGDFSLEVSDGGRWRVTHASEPSRTIFALSEDAPLLYAARTFLEAKEHQGSFEMSEREVETCQQPKVENIYYDGQALVMQGGFDDPSRGCETLTFEFQACAAPEQGHLSWGVTTSNPNFNFLIVRPTSSADERIYGLGEQFPHDQLDLKGRAIPLLSQEGGVGRGHVPISPAVNAASPGSAGSQNTTYYAAPHYITNTNRSLFLENSEYVIFDFREENHLALRLFAPHVDGRIIHGQSPLELVERYTEWAGRMPAPPQWINDGAIVALARPLDESQQIISDLKSDGAEISAVWNQTWSGTSETFIGEQVLWNWVQNENQLPTWGDFVATMNNQDVRVLCYINSMFRDVSELEGEPTPRRNLFAEAVEAGYLVKKEGGDPYMLEVTAFEVGLLDLTNEAARTWMKDVIKEEMITNAGCQGWMADFAEALPFDAELDSGVAASSYHNLYPVEWAKLNREAVEEAGKLGEILVFNRSGWSRTPSYSIMLWQGDQLTTWDKYDGLKSALYGLLNGGFSGIALNHSDIGGYTSLSRYDLGYKRESELLKRWTEMAAFTAMMRTHEGNQPEANAQIYSDATARAHFARMTRIYKALAFYRAGLFTEANTKGWPVVRHMMMEFPEDDRAQTTDDQFMLGSEFLVAPILEKCGDCDATREVYLPEGRWVHLWTGTSYGSTSGGEEIEITAPLGQPPVFYKRGSSVAAQLLINLEDAGVISN